MQTNLKELKKILLQDQKADLVIEAEFMYLLKNKKTIIIKNTKVNNVNKIKLI